ncbi:MAG: hypothetical protein QXR17_00095 [Candidatus Bathyarchaeia archaeon]
MEKMFYGVCLMASIFLEIITGIAVGLSFGFIISAFLSSSKEKAGAVAAFTPPFSSTIAVMMKYGAPLEAILTFILCSAVSLVVGFFLGEKYREKRIEVSVGRGLFAR